MRRFTRHSVVFFLTAALAILPVVSNHALAADAAEISNEDSPSLATAGVDLLAVRPLGIVSTVAGFAAYVVSLPFSIPGGNSGKVWKNCVVEPADYTFKRPLGEF
jgi:hypothetical protein